MEVIRIKPKHFPVPVAPFSYGIKVKGDSFLFIPNQIPIDSEGHIVGKGDIDAQATRVFENIKAILAEVQSTFEDIVKMTWYLTTRENWQSVVKIRKQYFREKWPAATFVLVEQLSHENILIEVNAIIAIR